MGSAGERKGGSHAARTQQQATVYRQAAAGTVCLGRAATAGEAGMAGLPRPTARLSQSQQLALEQLLHAMGAGQLAFYVCGASAVLASTRFGAFAAPRVYLCLAAVRARMPAPQTPGRLPGARGGIVVNRRRGSARPDGPAVLAPVRLNEVRRNKVRGGPLSPLPVPSRTGRPGR